MPRTAKKLAPILTVAATLACLPIMTSEALAQGAQVTLPAPQPHASAAFDPTSNQVYVGNFLDGSVMAVGR